MHYRLCCCHLWAYDLMITKVVFHWKYGVFHFLPRDASAERGDATVSRLSVCPSVTFRYRVQIRLNSSKIISPE